MDALETNPVRLTLLCLLFLVVTLGDTPAVAGPNQGGILLLHNNTDLSFTAVDPAYCGLSTLTDCESGEVRADGPGYHILTVFAAFPPETNPRVAGMGLGIDFDSTQVVVEFWGHCSDFELHTLSYEPNGFWTPWPKPNSGIVMTWEEPRTEHLIEALWMAAYSYYKGPGEFRLIDEPVKASEFADDSIPSELDPVIYHSTLGFNTPGDLPCPKAWDCRFELAPAEVTVYQPCGGTFPLDLYIHDVELLESFYTCVGFDTSLVSYDSRVIDVEFLGSTGRPVNPGSDSSCSPDCQTEGRNISAATEDPGELPSGSGRVATIRFAPKPAGAATSDICLSNSDYSDPEYPRNLAYVSEATGTTLTHSPYCFGDFNGDGDVTALDLIRNIPRWGTCLGDTQYDAIYDLELVEQGNYCASTSDGCIDVSDIQRVAGRWHLGCGGSQAHAGAPPWRAQRGIAPDLRISPPTQTVNGNPGDLASVDLLVDNAVDLAAFEAGLSFDPAVLQVAGVEIGSFLQDTGRTRYDFVPRIDNITGRVDFGACTTGSVDAADGDGLLATITFEIQDCPATSAVTIESATLTAIDGTAHSLGSFAGATINIDCVSAVPQDTPYEARLFPIRPNPMAQTARILFQVPQTARHATTAVDLSIFDASGRRIRTLVKESLPGGRHAVLWDGTNRWGGRVPSGTYFGRLLVGQSELKTRIVVAPR